MDTFHGYFRFAPRDCRYFASLYLFVRVIEVFTVIVTRDAIFIPIIGLCLIVLSLLVVIVKPYKNSFQNTVDATFFLLQASACLMTVTYLYSTTFEPQLPTTKPYYALTAILVLLLMLYGLGIFMKTITPQKIAASLKTVFTRCFTNRKYIEDNTEDVLPHRFKHKNELSPLLNVK